jgi:hypothetical protein
MNRNEQEMYSNISSIAKSLEKIAKTLDNKVSNELVDATTKDIPGFEGVLNDLDNLYQPNTLSDKCLAANCDGDECTHNDEDDAIHNDYLNDLVQNMNHTEYLNFHHDMAFGFASSDAAALTQHIYELEYEECLGAIQRALLITGDEDYVSAVASTGGIAPDWAGRKYVKELIEKENTTQPTNDPYTYDNDLNEYVNGIKNDSDHDIRSTAAYYEDEELANGKTKKDCILDYVTNEFGSHGARYTDIIKFAYYLGCSNAPKYTSENRGYYSLALAGGRGFLVHGGKDQLVKGINKEGKERYFALSFVESATAYWKRIS